DQLALHRQPGRRRAIEELRVDRDLGAALRRQLGSLAAELHLDAPRDDLLDEERELADRLALRVDIGLGRPAAGARVRADLERYVEAAVDAGRDRAPFRLDAVGADELQG